MESNKGIVAEINQIQKGHQTPIILNFQNGQLNLESTESKEFSCAIDAESKKETAILAINGNIYNGLIESNEQVDTYIAVRNKRTKTVRLIQTERALLINDIHRQEIPSAVKKMDDQLALKQLLKNFGGRKAGRYLERTERMKVNVDSVKEQLEKTVLDFNSDNEKEDENGQDIGVENIVPAFNKDAENITDIYTLTDIISENLLNRLNEEANEVLVTSEDLPIPSEYILNEIMAIKNSSTKNTPQNLTKIKVFLYMDALIALIKTKNRDLHKTTLSHITEKVENHIYMNFSPKDSTKPVKTSFSTDKAMCYFIALAILMSQNYEIDVNILTQELSRPRKKILLYASFVNAKLKPRTDILTLNLPKTQKKFAEKRRRTK